MATANFVVLSQPHACKELVFLHRTLDKPFDLNECLLNPIARYRMDSSDGTLNSSEIQHRHYFGAPKATTFLILLY